MLQALSILLQSSRNVFDLSIVRLSELFELQCTEQTLDMPNMSHRQVRPSLSLSLCSVLVISFSREFQRFTSQWFYDQSSEKYKRCGGAKVIREFHKQDQEHGEIEEDPGYGTLPTSVSVDSKDSGKGFLNEWRLNSMSSPLGVFVIHDRSVNNELNEFSKRLALLVDNLLADLAERHEEFGSHSSSSTATSRIDRCDVNLLSRTRSSPRPSTANRSRDSSSTNSSEQSSST